MYVSLLCIIYLWYMAKKLHRIKEILIQENRSGYWLAKETGISYNSINGYVNGKIEPSLTNLVRIAEVLDVDVRELVVGTK